MARHEQTCSQADAARAARASPKRVSSPKRDADRAEGVSSKRDADRAEGVSSPNAVQPFKVRALHDFTPAVFSRVGDEEILFFSQGQVVWVVDMDVDGHWWFGKYDESNETKQGWFPTAYVRKIER